jgi:hypothetical protein
VTPQKVGFLLLLTYLALTVFVGSGQVLTIARQLKILRTPATERELLLGRSVGFAMPTPHRVMSGHFQRSLERGTRDSVLFLADFLPLVTEAQVAASRFWLAPFSDPETVPIGKRGVVAIQGESRLLQSLALHTREGMRDVSNAANQLNNLARQIPGTALTVCVIPRAADWFVESPACSSRARRLFRGTRYLRAFREQLAPQIAFLYWGEDLAPYAALQGYYRTDHHLTTPALYDMYLRLLGTMSTQGPWLGPPVPHQQWFEVVGVEFLGTAARDGGGYRRITDSMADAFFLLPPLKTDVFDGQKFRERSRRNLKQDYLAGRVPQAELVHHYTEYFGHDHGIIRYRNPERRPGRVLLVIGDSNDNPIEPLLASHFRTSYFVHPGEYRQHLGRDFDVAEFVEEHRVSHLLYFGSQEKMFHAPASSW